MKVSVLQQDQAFTYLTCPEAIKQRIAPVLYLKVFHHSAKEPMNAIESSMDTRSRLVELYSEIPVPVR